MSLSSRFARSLPLLAGSVTLLTGADRASADITAAQWQDATHFNFNVNYMPDLDQRRAGLIANGSMFCVPTSMMNIFAYAAEWGFPSLEPGEGVWQGDVPYATLTNDLIDLGALMDTGDDGTGVTGWFNGVESWLSGFPITYNAYYKGEDYCPTLSTAAHCAAAGSLVAICYGRYDFNPGPQPIVATDSNSGHCVTVAEMSADGGDEMTLFVRDPASDESPDNLFAQSPWADTTYTTVETMSVLQDWDENSAYHPYDVTVLNYDANDDEIRFIHKVYSITPGVGYEFTGIELNIDPIIDEISWGNSPSGQFAPPQAGDSFLDVQLHPEMWGLYVLVGSTGGTPSLRLIDRATGNQSLVAQIPGATDLVVGRRREVFVLAGNLVYRVDIDTPGAPSLLISSQALSAGGYNDATDELCLLSGTQRQLWVLPNAGQGAPQIFSLPTAIPASTNPQMAVRESDGAIAIVVPETPGLVHGLRRTSTGQLEYKVYALTGADAQSVCFDDRERLLVNTTDGKIVELQSTGTGWWSWAVVPTAESWYGNVGEATNYRVSRSRTNYDPAINANDDIDTPAEEVETLGRNVYDCPGDADGDMEIGFTDLLSLLTKWGPCNNCPEDLDGDDDVGFADLLALLTKWGPCPGL